MLSVCAIRAAANVNGPPLVGVVTDKFNRVASTTSLGTADTGQAWTAHTGTWGIIGGKAYLATRVGDSGATIDSGLADGNVYCDITRDAEPGLHVRYVDSNNFIEVHCNATTIQMWKRVGGTYTNIQNVAATITAGNTYNFRIELAGTTIKVYLDGVLVMTASGVTDFSTATRHGLRQNDTGAARYDNFRVTA